MTGFSSTEQSLKTEHDSVTIKVAPKSLKNMQITRATFRENQTVDESLHKLSILNKYKNLKQGNSKQVLSIMNQDLKTIKYDLQRLVCTREEA